MAMGEGGMGEGGLAQRGYGGTAQPGGNVSSGIGNPAGGGGNVWANGGSGSSSGSTGGTVSKNYVGPGFSLTYAFGFPKQWPPKPTTWGPYTTPGKLYDPYWGSGGGPSGGSGVMGPAVPGGVSGSGFGSKGYAEGGFAPGGLTPEQQAELEQLDRDEHHASVREQQLRLLSEQNDKSGNQLRDLLNPQSWNGYARGGFVGEEPELAGQYRTNPLQYSPVAVARMVFGARR